MSRNVKLAVTITLSAVLIFVLVVGLRQASKQEEGSGSATVPTNTVAALKGSPPALAKVHAQANRLLPGTAAIVKHRIKSFGRPTVLNKWASWCGPCKFEFPSLQSAALRFGKRIAFLGLNSGDNSDDAAKFLKKFPVSYPSYEDPKEKIAQALGIGNNYPVTVFYDRAGKVSFIHQGSYATSAKLDQDIRRYAR